MTRNKLLWQRSFCVTNQYVLTKCQNNITRKTDCENHPTVHQAQKTHESKENKVFLSIGSVSSFFPFESKAHVNSVAFSLFSCLESRFERFPAINRLCWNSATETRRIMLTLKECLFRERRLINGNNVKSVISSASEVKKEGEQSVISRKCRVSIFVLCQTVVLRCVV